MQKSTRWLPLLAVAAAVLLLVPSALAQPAPGTTLYALLGANRFPGGANTAVGTLRFVSDTQITLEVKVTGTDVRAWTPRVYSRGNCSGVLNWVGTRGTDGLPLHAVMTNASEAPQALFGADVARIHAALERGERLALMLAGAGSGGATNQSPYRTCTNFGTTPPATTSTTTTTTTATTATTSTTTTTRTTTSATTAPPPVDLGLPPAAASLAVTTPEDTPVSITLAATDADGHALTFGILAPPAHGTLGAISSPVCPPGVPRTCTATVSYTPALNYSGPDSFSYAAYDPFFISNAGTVSITITPVDDAPVAVADAYTTPEDTQLVVPPPGVLGNDTDADGDLLTAMLVTGPTHSPSWSFNTDGSIFYTPAPNYNGPDTFTYRAFDGTAFSNVATVAITVTSVDDPAINIVKFVNGLDAETPTGPHLAVGSTVTFTYVVTNTGDVPLANVVVNDDMLGAITSFSGDANTNGLLDLTETWTYTKTGTALAGQQTNVGTVTAQNVNPPGTTVTDTNPANYFGDAADLAITKSDGATAVVPGTNTTYTITVTNNGPSTVTGATVSDVLPAGTEFVSATNGATYDSGTNTVHFTTGTLATGGSTSFQTTLAVAPALTGSLSNTATVAPPAGVTDPTSANNSATDTDTLTPQADLAITKSDGATAVVPGTNTTYTITVTNNGPSTVTGATVSDVLPAGTEFVSATNGATYDSGTNTVHFTTGTLATGGSTSFQTTLAVAPALTGSLSNTATVAPPAGVTDPTSANNSATDTDTLTPQADLAITKSDGATAVVPGTNTTYTITVTNNGPSTVTGATVSDSLPAGVTAATWAFAGATAGGSVTGPTSGSGALATTVNLPVGATVTFTFTVQVSPSATGSLVNTATVSPPAGTTDPDPADNSATDIDTLTPRADLSITKTGPTSAVPGTTITYTVTVTNTGPSTGVDAPVADVFPSAITAVSWTAVASPGSSVAAASGTGNITTTVTLLPGGTVTFTAVAQLSPAATGLLSNTATVGSGSGTTDPSPGNNEATHTVSLLP